MTYAAVNAYTHPSVVCGKVIEVPLKFIVLLAQIFKSLYCLLETVMSGGEGQVEDIRNEIGRRYTWMESILPKEWKKDATHQWQDGECSPIAQLLRSSHLSWSLPLC